MQEKVWTAMKLAGTNCNPWDAWLTHNGLKTLTLRMDRHQANATALANYLKDHNQVAQVNYLSLTDHPDHLLAKQQMSGFGGMMSFELKGGLEAGIKFMSTLAPTLGDTDTLILHPASMSHKNVEQAMRERNGITDGLIRVSVGIESVEDIIADMDQAISSIQ
jgi:methionine-gamma-lyase